MIKQFYFSENRNYVQGSDIIDHIFCTYDINGAFRFKVLKPIYNNIVEISEEESSNTSAIFYDEKNKFYINQISKDSNLRKIYKEDVFKKNLTFNKTTAILKSFNKYSTTQCMVTLFKLFLLSKYGAINKDGQWLFVYFEGERSWGINYNEILINLVYKKKYISKGGVEVNGVNVGFIYFNWGII
ncbi:MAG: hypothetical protein IKN65_09405 [Clostridia bacterium]|nr:hypothetical protein [Clostridia bacterium]